MSASNELLGDSDMNLRIFVMGVGKITAYNNLDFFLFNKFQQMRSFGFMGYLFFYKLLLQARYFLLILRKRMFYHGISLLHLRLQLGRLYNWVVFGIPFSSH